MTKSEQLAPISKFPANDTAPESKRFHPFFHRSTKILYYQQFSLLGLAALSFIYFRSYPPALLTASLLIIITIDIIGFFFLGLGFHFSEKIKQTNRLEITFLVTMIFAWIIFTMINRSLLLFHLLTADEWLVDNIVEYPLDEALGLDLPLFFYTWIIALVFLTAIFLLISRLLRKISPESVKIDYYIIFAAGNGLSLLYIAVSVDEFWFWTTGAHMAPAAGPGFDG